ncbi:hypothetical protein [Winogradskyella psychrotolerans]|uniref:hypothetical protein n=1 Tax=Winogradskyella psychrotolerans TaxID=1344585 RepID=UPI001C066901|nr:hypothetical protein [Winogradskyella psychrotolerans]MBU2928201.1 hypothetical protein [Winogradskyella psychrotolerans]
MQSGKKKERETILLADREAPLGWVYLRIYKDKTFEFESRGLERVGDIYAGNVELKNDTIYFKYLDSIPKAGNKAILTEKFVSYFNGDYPERLEIKKSIIKTKN